MTSLDPSHLPTRHDDPYRGRALYDPGLSKVSGRRKLPIPDLRFEQSYLRSVHSFIHGSAIFNKSSTETQRGSGEKGKDIQTAGRASGVEATAPGLYGVPLHFDWSGILYVTTRDQILSPLAQGAAWAFLSYYLRPFLGGIGAWVRIHFVRTWKSVFPPIEPHIRGGVGWMHDQFRGFTAGSIGTNIALAK